MPGRPPSLSGNQQRVIELMHHKNRLIFRLGQLRFRYAAIGPSNLISFMNLEKLCRRLSKGRFAVQDSGATLA